MLSKRTRPPRYVSRVRALVAGLVALQLFIFAAGVAGVLVVDTIRAYSVGQTFYTKEEKRAAYHLWAYALSAEPRHYARLREAIDTPQAYALARILLECPAFPLHHGVAFLRRGGMTAAVASAGTGLGLAITKQLIDATGGGLHIASAPRSGTRVTIRLPRVAPQPAKE